MRVRGLIRERKRLMSDTGWRETDLQPRFAPVFLRTTPIRKGWSWRSATATGGAGDFVLLVKCNPKYDNWQAVLMLTGDNPAFAIARYEHHGSHPGLHAHAHCERGGLEQGPPSLDNLLRAPDARAFHRRHQSWKPNPFWEASKRFFRIREQEGDLP